MPIKCSFHTWKCHVRHLQGYTFPLHNTIPTPSFYTLSITFNILSPSWLHAVLVNSDCLKCLPSPLIPRAVILSHLCTVASHARALHLWPLTYHFPSAGNAEGSTFSPLIQAELVGLWKTLQSVLFSRWTLFFKSMTPQWNINHKQCFWPLPTYCKKKL